MDEFLRAVKTRSDMHPYVLQKGYQALAGDASLESEIIEYLLKQSNQPNALRNYVLGKKYLEFLAESDQSRIKFKKFYRNGTIRNALFVLFLVFSLFAASPFFIAGIVIAKDGRLKSIFQLLCLSVIFGLYTAFIVRQHIKLVMAEKLVKQLEDNDQKNEATSINLLVSGDELNYAPRTNNSVTPSQESPFSYALLSTIYKQLLNECNWGAKHCIYVEKYSH